ncbi:MAG: ABC transporter substrate-binding protein, partial [Chloroflexota bacterium]
MNKRFTLFIAVIALLALAIGAVNAQDAENVQIDDTELAGMSWDEIVAAAEGGTVNWFMWGGSDVINSYVSDYIGGVVMEEYGITLNRVGINDTADAVNTVLGEAEAGQDTDGTVDMIWINGENFRTMKQGGLLFCGYWDMLPNMAFVNQEDPTITFDFGTAVDECEVPWSRAQVAMIYNSAFVEDVPADMDALLAWVEANPGRFTYPAPPDFTGSVFVRHVFYNEADKLFPDEGGYEVLLGEFDEEIYSQVAEATWATLNDLEA